MKHTIMLIIKGFIMGVANIIPGVSGGTLAITLGIYEQLIGAISHFFNKLKENLKFIIPIGIGMVASILLLSKAISYSLDQFPFPTILFFIGLIIGGVPLLYRKVKKEKKIGSNGVIFLITFGIVILMAVLKTGTTAVTFSNLGGALYPILFLVGMIAAATMVIPGVSGSFILMLLGFYEPIIKTISNLTKMDKLGSNLLILIPFGIGILIGIVLVSKLIEFLLKKYEKKTYFGILGFVSASILTLIKSLIGISITPVQVIIGIILLLVGGVIAYKLGDE